jgi:hypothetical protein
VRNVVAPRDTQDALAETPAVAPAGRDLATDLAIFLAASRECPELFALEEAERQGLAAAQGIRRLSWFRAKYLTPAPAGG